MNRRGKTRFAEGEHSYWQSYSDMMAALMLMFILIIAITLSIYKQKTVDLDATRLELNSAKEDLEAYVNAGVSRIGCSGAIKALELDK